MLKLYLIDDYNEICPDLKGEALTDKILRDILREEGLEDPDLLRTEAGKPYEKNGRIFFSISHSGSCFACALADNEVGVDIEMKTPKDPIALAKRFFTSDEVIFLSRTEVPVENMDCSGDTGRPGPEGLATASRRIWTRKEALLKYRGTTLDEILRSESVLDREDVDFIDLDLAGGLIGCICVESGESGEVEIISRRAGEM